MSKGVKMKYISRIDQVVDKRETRCWTVRIMIGTPYQIYKTFTDGRYENKDEALKAAIIFRDQKLLKHKKAFEKYKAKINGVATYDKMERWPLFRSKGYRRREFKRKDGSVYRFYYAHCNDRYTKIEHCKAFEFKKYGGAVKAKQLAIAWREKKVRMVHKKARALGLRP